MAAKKAPAKKMAAPKKTGNTFDSSKLTESQKKNLAASAKIRTDRYGLSGMGETKSGVTAKDMAKINKGRDKFDKKMPIDQMITPRGNVRGYMGVYDDPAKARAAAAAKKKRKK